MARYKVPQDVEAEDHLLGPLTPRQLVYVFIVAVSVWLIVLLAQQTFTLIFLPLPLSSALFFGLLVVLGIKNRSQPAELYLAAIVRFFLKPRKRVWDQEGAQQTVNITAPKKEIHEYTDHLSRTEVRSRLKRLADVLDSRGWSARGASGQSVPPTIAPPIIVQPTGTSKDNDERLISLNQLKRDLEPQEVHASDDPWDASASPVAQYFDQKISETQERFRQNAIKHMQDPSYNPYPSIKQRVLQPLSETDTSSTQQQSFPQNQTPTTADSPEQPEPEPKPSTLSQEDIARLVNQGAANMSISTISKEAERLQTLSDNQTISLHNDS